MGSSPSGGSYGGSYNRGPSNNQRSGGSWGGGVSGGGGTSFGTNDFGDIVEAAAPIIGSAIGGGFSGGVSSALGGSGSGPSAETVLNAPTGSNYSDDGIFGGGFGSFVDSATQLFRPASALYSGYQAYKTNEDIEDELKQAQSKSERLINPFLNDKFEPGDLTQDPGYQFNLEQGQQALERSQAARGNYFSGRAMKEAQQFGQGLAENTYNDAFGRWLQERGLSMNAAGQLADVYGNTAQIGAESKASTNNAFSKALAQLLGNGRADDEYMGAY